MNSSIENKSKSKITDYFKNLKSHLEKVNEEAKEEGFRYPPQVLYHLENEELKAVNKKNILLIKELREERFHLDRENKELHEI